MVVINESMAISRLDDDEKGVHSMDTLGRRRAAVDPEEVIVDHCSATTITRTNDSLGRQLHRLVIGAMHLLSWPVEQEYIPLANSTTISENRHASVVLRSSWGTGGKVGPRGRPFFFEDGRFPWCRRSIYAM